MASTASDVPTTVCLHYLHVTNATKVLNIKSSGKFPSVLGVVVGDWPDMNCGSFSVGGM
jgi:hypothetical protein